MLVLQLILGIIVILAVILLLGYVASSVGYKGAGGTHTYSKPPKCPKPQRAFGGRQWTGTAPEEKK